MAFDCTYDSALTNLNISSGDIVAGSDLTTIINAVNELKGYLASTGGYSVSTANYDCGADNNKIEHVHISSIRTIADQIDPTTNCPCNWYGTDSNHSSNSDCIDASYSWSDDPLTDNDTVDEIDFNELRNVFNQFQTDLKRRPSECGCDNNCTCNTQCSCEGDCGCDGDCSHDGN